MKFKLQLNQMKAGLLLLLILFSSNNSFGQKSILNSETTFQDISFTFFIIQSIATAVTANQNAFGQNQTWDHSSLDGTTELIWFLLQVEDPNVKQYFPETNQIRGTEIPGAFFEQRTYIYVDGDEVTIHGDFNNAQGIDQFHEYTDRKLLYALPASFGDSWTDKYLYEPVGPLKGFQGSEDGTREAEVDGEGTLIIPSGTYQNVLRIRIVESGTSQSFLNGSPIGPKSTFERVIYEFWRSDIGEPLARLIENTIDGQTFYENFYLGVNPLGIDQPQDEDLTVFPNPMNSFFYLDLGSQNLEEIEISIFDIAGKEFPISTDLANSVGSNLRVETSHLAPGHYTITVRFKDKVKTKRLVKI